MPAVQETLKLVPGLELETVESSCCGMAGMFGYQARDLRREPGDGRANAASGR